MNGIRVSDSERFRAWVPDFDRWPASWMGIEDDLAYGRKLLPYFSGFLRALLDEGMSKRTFASYRDSRWLLGGTIVREVSRHEAYQEDPRATLVESVAGDGILPDHYRTLPIK